MKSKMSIITLVALALGVIAGLYAKTIVSSVAFVGTIYINLLKFMISPIIFSSIAVTIYQSAYKKDKLVLKAIVVYVLMFVATYLLSSGIIALIDPAQGFTFSVTDWDGTVSSLSIQEIIINLFPSNIIDIFQTNKLFSIILLAYLIGKCASKVENGDKLIDLIKAIRDIFFKILQYIMYLTPLAVFALIGNTIANYGSIIIGVGLKYIGMAYLCGLISLIVIMILPMAIITKKSPIYYLKKIYKIWLITLTTCSSAATLPSTMKLCKEDLNIPNNVIDVVSPLGCTIHMCGGAVSFALLGLFCSRLFNIEINLFTYIFMLIAALIINMSAPGIPNGGVVIGASYLALLNIPLDFIGFYSGIYKILDMLYTSLNVTGNISANVIINQQIKK